MIISGIAELTGLDLELEQYQLLIDIFVLSNTVAMITNFIPFIRLDGYWILSAATNVKFIFVYEILNFIFLIFSIITGLYLFVQFFSYSGIPQWVKIAIVLFESTLLTIILFQIWKRLKIKY